ncbi:hypothetical protein [Flavobacterium sp. 25HG05S-40]|uniref:hypothetical protein n=1 Tax=Flavobacterium sp. 25HG05S-40 TaxID=3458682 RepID=UPI004044FB22
MSNPTTRKDFLKKSLFLASGITLVPSFLHAKNEKVSGALNPKMVYEFVNDAHTDFDKVKKMLEATPLLLNAAWDWGGGDFETALGAAAHMGQKETANFLIAQGARTDIFVLTMLGKTEIVKAMLKEYPNLLHSQGPHGFTLLHHAEKGGQDAEQLMEYLQNLGLKETFMELKK